MQAPQNLVSGDHYLSEGHKRIPDGTAAASPASGPNAICLFIIKESSTSPSCKFLVFHLTLIGSACIERSKTLNRHECPFEQGFVPVAGFLARVWLALAGWQCHCGSYAEGSACLSHIIQRRWAGELSNPVIAHTSNPLSPKVPQLRTARDQGVLHIDPQHSIRSSCPLSLFADREGECFARGPFGLPLGHY